MVYEPYRGDMIGYIVRMHSAGAPIRFRDVDAYFELDERGLMLPRASFERHETDTRSVIYRRTKNLLTVLDANDDEHRVHDALDGPWDLRGIDMRTFYDLGYRL